MSSDWLAALNELLADGQDVVLVSVARTAGSAPRDAGATMVVGAAATRLTIGGGHLEWQGIGQARRMLEGDSRQAQVSRYNLGARLGQCCGGVVWLLFEYVPAASRPAWQARLTASAGGQRLQRRIDRQATSSHWAMSTSAEEGTTLVGDADNWDFVQEVVATRWPVYLFGAGHVAQALVRQLLLLGAALTWIDSRDEAFAGVDTNGLQTVLTDLPESEVAQAPAGTFFLVMTHSHTLDFALCEAIYQRHDFAYFGLIGSRSKRASFEHRLLERGLARPRLAEMTCPIGIPGIASKEPAAIALAVAAQILQIHHARQLLSQAGRPRLPASTISPE